jgi:16S rRNA (guanine527-N7)-methyltransferase
VTPGEFADKLKARALSCGCALNPALVDPLHAYYEVLSAWNQKINLTAVNLLDLPPDAVDRLFIEPIAAAQIVPDGQQVIDIGSGGGSPAIPFALASRSTALTMIESRTRKSTFLREAARAVQINATVITSRFEVASQRHDLQGAFDTLTMRAVRIDEGTLPELAQLIRPNGALLLFQRAPMDVPQPPPNLIDEFHQLTPTSGLQVFKPRM